MRFRLRTLIIVLVLGPPIVAARWLYPLLPLAFLHAVVALAPIEIILLISFLLWYHRRPKVA